MSRSFKKHPAFTNREHSHKYKKLASRRIRHRKGISNGGHYKKFNESWIICDYKSVWYSRNSFWRYCKEYWPERAIKLFYEGFRK